MSYLLLQKTLTLVRWIPCRRSPRWIHRQTMKTFPHFSVRPLIHCRGVWGDAVIFPKYGHPDLGKILTDIFDNQKIHFYKMSRIFWFFESEYWGFLIPWFFWHRIQQGIHTWDPTSDPQGIQTHDTEGSKLTTRDPCRSGSTTRDPHKGSKLTTRDPHKTHDKGSKSSNPRQTNVRDPTHDKGLNPQQGWSPLYLGNLVTIKLVDFICNYGKPCLLTPENQNLWKKRGIWGPPLRYVTLPKLWYL